MSRINTLGHRGNNLTDIDLGAIAALTGEEIDAVAGGFFKTFIVLAKIGAAIAPPDGECEVSKDGNRYVIGPCGPPK